MTRRVALVTGGARGIGGASCIALARDGADIAICDLGEESSAAATMAEVAAAGRTARYYRADVSDRARIEAMFDAIQADFGRLDIVVNNAAYSVRNYLVDLDYADVERVWAVIQGGTFHCSQLGARRMIAQQSGGSIVMISSVHAERPFPRSTAYNGAKAAVNQMALTWAAELAPHHIRVNVIEPGWTDTPGERAFYSEEQIRKEGAALPLGRLAEPSEIASAVRFLCSGNASYVTGSILRVDGGIILPAAR